jgi:protein-tyrosine phosphatase
MVKRKTYQLKNLNVEQGDKGIFTIHWKSKAKDIGVEVFVGDSPRTINREASIASVKGKTSVKIDGLDPDARHYFEVVSEGGWSIIAAERNQPFKGVINFRDLGGYETADGRRLKWGEVFRSGHLARVSEEDKRLIQRMGIKVVCDFRTPAETEAQPDWLPEDGSTTYLQYPIVHGEFDPAAAMESMQKGDISWLTKDFMIKRYIQKIDDFPQVWGEILNRLADFDNRPLVFHCTAGKDRAGACAALILLALGVPEDTVIYDHGLSNVYIADALEKINERVRAMGVDPEKVAPYFTAPRSAIVAFVDHIRKSYGSASEYLLTRAGVNKKTLELLKKELLD